MQTQITIAYSENLAKHRARKAMATVLLCCSTVLAIAAGCSRTPEPDTPGQCPLDCSKAVIANSSYKSVPINVPSAYVCANLTAGTVVALDPVLLLFKVTGKKSDAPGESDGKKKDDSYDPTEYEKRGISIQPVIMGAMDPAASLKAGNVSKLGDGTYEPTRHIGIATPKEEWCTDACGVFSVEITPVCAVGLTNTVSVSATSGAMNATASSFAVTATEAGKTTLKAK